MKPEPSQISEALRCTALLSASLLITAAVYWPGLSGPFVFDDYATLPALGAMGGVDSLGELWRFLTTGITGPTGRPLSLLSFLLDDIGWPSSPERFKYTSLMFHLLCLSSVFWLLFALEHRVLASSPRNAVLIAAIAAGLWAVNPSFSSTVLYVVQRMTMLSALVVLLGLIAWVYARTRVQSNPVGAYIGMSLALTIGTGLGVLAKENAVLLPLLALGLELVLFQPRASQFSGLNRMWIGVFMLGPVLLSCAYLAYHWPIHAQTYVVLGMEPWQRLLTECRVLLSYLYQLLVPQFAADTVFHDGFLVSRSLWQPPGTLPAVLAVLGMAFIAWTKRAAWPRWSAALALFLLGHSLEASVLPLELYFAHRNYLPASLLFWPLAAALVNCSLPSPRLAMSALLVYAALFPLATFTQATVWGRDEGALHLYWAQRVPDSPRAQRLGAIELVSLNRVQEAGEMLRASLQRHPSHLPTRLHLIALQCGSGVPRATFDDAVRAAGSDAIDFRAFQILRVFIEAIASGRCSGVDAQADTQRFLYALEQNASTQALPAGAAQVAHLAGHAALIQQRPEQALEYFRQSLQRFASADAGITQVGLLAGAGEFELALQQLALVRSIIADDTRSHAGLSASELKAEIDRLEGLLREEIALKTRP